MEFLVHGATGTKVLNICVERCICIVSAPSVLKFSKKKAREIEKLLPILEFFISSTGF